MDNFTDFIIYCLEEYKHAEQLSGKETYELFQRFGVLDYLRSSYDALHTTGGPYIVEDINLYIKNHAAG